MFFVLCPALLYGQNIESGLIFHYKFDGDLTDAGINNITQSGDVQFGADRLGNPSGALVLNGSTQFLTTSSNLTKPNLPVSYSFWVKFDENNRWNHVINTNYFTNGYHGTWIQINPEGRIAAGFGDGSGCICPSARQSFKSEAILNPNEWYFIIITIDKAFDFQLFINCKEENIILSGSGSNTIAYDAELSNIGKSNTNDGPRFFKGSLDDLRYWNRSILQSEIDLLISQNIIEPNQKEMNFLSYSIENQASPAQINYDTRTIYAEVSCGTDLTNLVANFIIDDGPIVRVNGSMQSSGVTENDFSSPLIYTFVNDKYCSSANWTVVVEKQATSVEDSNLLTSFLDIGIENQLFDPDIDSANYSITFEVICEANIESLYLSFTINDGTKFTVSGSNFDSGSQFNFIEPLNIKLINEVACVSQDWQVKVIQNNYVEEDFTDNALLFIPNIITPNKDGINENFELGELLIGSSLTIVNRYGGKVYESSNYQNDFNGASLSPGVYYFAIENSCYSELIKGTLSILH